jgi:cytoskeletal protein RodZ
MSTSAFGEHLRRERELRGVSLEEVSAATRISIGFLEALERGDWQKLPGGIFRRGFIRSAGRFLGLDEDNLIAEYALETGDTSQTTVTAKAVGPDLRHGLLLGGIAVAILLIIAAFSAWRHFYHHAPTQVKQEGHPSAKIGPLRDTRVLETSGGPAELTTKDAVSASTGSAISVTAQNASMPSPTTPAAGSATRPQAGAQQSIRAPGDVISDGPILSPPVPRSSEAADGPATQNSPALTTGLSLRIQATRETPVRILADGEEIYKGTMTAGEWRNFRAVQGMEIFADDGSAIHLELNGKPVHAGASAAAGQPLHVTLPAGGGTNPGMKQ